ncbi:hypothetical protein DY000_02040927 [Brassica cretica]|uniref:Aspartic peptidase DDI1-type domain-containing protein n=1 Tax=Brassica cretica TaxID=69181 RepID=A0ABQ7BHW2_BRACR|nr:hypothetical protein DY000_02040927 [Brassica cretica]
MMQYRSTVLHFLDSFLSRGRRTTLPSAPQKAPKSPYFFRTYLNLYVPISTRSSKEELLFYSDPTRLERSIRKEDRISSIDTTSTTSIDTTSTTLIDICDRATIDSSTRTLIDTNPRADMVATLVLQRDENGYLHDPGGHLCNATGQKIDGQGTAILEPSAAAEDKVPLQRSLADLTRPSQFYTNRCQCHDARRPDFAARHPHAPTLSRVKRDNIDRQQHDVINRQQHWSIDRQQQKSSNRQPPIPYRTSVCLKTTEKISQQSAKALEQKQTLAETSFVESVDRRHLPCIDRRHLPSIDRHQTDGYEPAIERQATKEEITVEKRVKSRKPYIPKHLRREVNNLKDFTKGESWETDKDIELLFDKISRKTQEDTEKFLILCSIHRHHLPNALCDTGSAVSIMAIDTAEQLGLKKEPSKDSFTFGDSSRVNSTSMIKNVKVEIGECIIHVDFHAMDIKSGKTSPLLYGRAFMATVGTVCDLK